MKWQDRWTTAIVLLGLSTLTGAEVQATTVLAVPLEQMTAEAEVVVHARVGAQQVTWDQDHTRILTLTSIEVIEGIKGARKGDLLTIYQVAGTLDGVTFRIPGALDFAPGDEMVFFAQRFEDKIVSYGMGLGKYRVQGQGPDKVVMPEFGDVTFVKRDSDGSYVPGGAPPEVVLPLAAFLSRLRTELEHPTWQPTPRLRTRAHPDSNGAGGMNRAGPASARQRVPDAPSGKGGAR
ncbi:MAG: hypothetical protein ABIJ09_24080 [Pseudomonadota bacterium]